MKKEKDLEVSFDEIVRMIETRRNNAFRKVNEELIALYWDFGKYISEKVNDGNWGEKIIDKLAEFMKCEYPTLKGFNRRGIYRMKQFYETYKDNEIVSTLLTQISWSNNVIILSSTKSMEEKDMVEENEEAKYKRKDFLYGNILNKDFDLLKEMSEYRLPDYIPNVNENNKCKGCGKGCKAIKIAHGLSINDCDTEMCNKK